MTDVVVPIPKKQKKKKQKSYEPETVQVEFLFCDMNTKCFHGIKFITSTYCTCPAHSSMLADLITENERSSSCCRCGGSKKKAAKSNTNTSSAQPAMIMHSVSPQ
ncbi:hypothetical protein ACHAXR_010460 [Thalassiosira sp. AJA248-18]